MMYHQTSIMKLNILFSMIAKRDPNKNDRFVLGSPKRLSKILKRWSSKEDVEISPSVSECSSYFVFPEPDGVLFGRALQDLFQQEQKIPQSIMDSLRELYFRGPSYEGIFRKSANQRQVKELKARMDAGEFINMEEQNISVLGATLKNFLRSMPDCLLCNDLFDQWIGTVDITDKQERICQNIFMCARLPQAHLVLLQYIICMLYAITENADENLMTVSNIAICFTPTLLWKDIDGNFSDPAIMNKSVNVIEFLITNSQSIFGMNIKKLLDRCSEPIDDTFNRSDWRRRNNRQKRSSYENRSSIVSFEVQGIKMDYSLQYIDVV